MNNSATAIKPLVISEKVPMSSRSFVEALSKKVLGETALHVNCLTHEDPEKIGRMLRIFKGYESYKKYRVPPIPIHPTDFREPDWRARKLLKETILPAFESDPNVSIVEHLDLSAEKLSVHSEFGKLNTVYVRFPHNLDWGEPINEREKEMQHNRPDRLRALLQHANFVDMILASGSKVIIGFMDTKRDMMDDMDSAGHHLKRPIMPEEVYTRDVVQVVGEAALLGSMATPIRSPETCIIKGTHGRSTSGHIEFGDWFMAGNGRVLVTSGDRTQVAAIQEMVAIANAGVNGSGKWEHHILHKVGGVLHGDCVKGAIPANDGHTFEGAYFFPDAFVSREEAERVLVKLYGRIIGTISDGTRKVLGANLLWLNPSTVILNGAATEMGEMLEKYGKQVLRPNLGEIAKGDGSGRCSSAPLNRD